MFEEIKDNTREFLYSVVWGPSGNPEDVGGLLDDESNLDSISDKFNKNFQVSDNRKERYEDYEDLSQEGIPSNVLEIYADDTIGHKLEGGKRLWVTAENEEVQAEANKKLDEWGIRGQLWNTTYFMMLFGDFMWWLDTEENEGVTNIHYDFHPIAFRRWEIKNQLAGFELRGESDEFERGRSSFGVKNRKSRLIEPFSALHFRLGTSISNLKKEVKGGIREGGYGSSIFESNLADLKKLNVSENSLVVSRYQNQRRPMLLFIDVANYKKGREKQKQLFKKLENRIVKNPSKSDSGFDSMNDLFANSEMVTLPHDPQMIDTMDLSETVDVESIADIEYIRDRVMGNFKVPSAFLGLEDKLPSTDVGQSSLISISTRYARSVRRIQAATILPLRRLLRIHFGLKGTFLDTDDIEVHTKTITTAEDLNDVQRAEKIASAFSSITQLFGRGPLGDVDLNADVFAKKIIETLNIGLDVEDIINIDKKGEEVDTDTMKEIEKFLTGGSVQAPYHPDQRAVPGMDTKYESMDEWKRWVKNNC